MATLRLEHHDIVDAMVTFTSFCTSIQGTTTTRLDVTYDIYHDASLAGSTQSEEPDGCKWLLRFGGRVTQRDVRRDGSHTTGTDDVAER